MTRINEKQLDIIERCNGCGDEAIQTRRSLIFEYLDVCMIYTRGQYILIKYKYKYIFFKESNSNTNIYVMFHSHTNSIKKL